MRKQYVNSIDPKFILHNPSHATAQCSFDGKKGRPYVHPAFEVYYKFKYGAQIVEFEATFL